MISEILTALVSVGTVLCFRPEVTAIADSLFIRFFGKAFSARGPFIQCLLLAGISLLLFLVLHALLRREPASEIPAVLLCIISLVLVFRLCLLQVIRRDDYWEIKNALKYDLPGYLAYECTHAQGRYFSFFQKGFCHYLDPDLFLRIMLIVNIILLCLGMTGLVREVQRRTCGERPRFIKSLCMGICLAIGMVFMSPAVWEVWFWGAGGLIYGSGIVCSVFVLLFLPDRKPVPLILSILCGCGCSELAAVTICIFTLAAAVKPLLSGKKPEKFLICCFLLSLACSATALLISQDLTYAGELVSENSGISLISKVIAGLGNALQNTAVFTYSRIEYLLLFSLAAFCFGTVSAPGQCTRRQAGSAAVVLLTAVVATAFVNAFLGFAPPRVLTFPLSWFFLACAAGCFMLGARLQVRRSGVILLLCCALCTLVVCSFYRENHKTLEQTRALWEVRDAALHSLPDKTKPAETCYLPVIGSIDRDLMEDPDYEFNIVTAYYYDLPQVTAAEPCE